MSGGAGLWRLVMCFKGGILSSWEEQGGTVVLTRVFVMRFMNVKDLGEALSDAEHRLVCVNFSLMIVQCITPLQGSYP